MRNLLTSNKVLQLFGYQAASTTNITGATELDLGDHGADAVLFAVLLGDMVNLSDLTLTIHQGDTSGSLSASDATVNVVSDGTDDTVVLLEVVKPTARYLEPQLTIATQNAEIHSIIAIVGAVRDEPTTQESMVIADELFLSPADA